LKKIIDNYPSAQNIVVESLQFDIDRFKDILFDLTKFEVPHPLTEARAFFIFELFSRRRDLILEMCGG
jgi:7,8-dihydro-6-hydroxymethylpterin-pyrophosphokinase